MDRPSRPSSPPARFRAALALLLLAACSAPAPLPPVAGYPATRTEAVVDDYHGEPVADPYRWLEDDRSEETAAWVARQNELTESVLARLPERESLRGRLAELWNHPRRSPPAREGHLYAWMRNDGLQAQDVLVVSERADGGERVLLDPNAWSEDGTRSLAGTSFSDDGRRLAYAVSEGGSDWRTIRVLDVESGREVGDELRWVKFSTPAWRPDGSGFFYSRYPEPAPGEALSGSQRDMAVYEHRLGEPQSADRLVHANPAEPRWNFSAFPTEDGRWLVLSTWRSTERRNLVHVRPLDAAPSGAWTALDDTWEVGLDFLGNDGESFYFLTEHGAPRGRIVVIDARDPSRGAWRTVVAEGADTLQSATLVGDVLVLRTLRDAQHRLRLVGLRDGAAREVELPGVGSVAGLAARRRDRECFFSFSSFTQPGAIHRLDPATGETALVSRADVAFEPEDYETSQIVYASRDGTRVPMFLVHRRGLRPDGDRPVYLYGYGGFNISLTPAFNVALVPWLDAGGLYAQPSLRGGGEYGEAWHEAGMLGRKQNVFDDFVAAAEALVSLGWTRPGRIAIGGRSNGGLLVGVALTQRPDLFGCALPGVGVLDMLRYHRFTIGHAWAGEYGRADDPAHFPFLRAYSPLHNLRAGTAYPPTLIFTADHDDRVVPAHSFKFAAALQAAQGGEAPVLIRVETRAGHGAGKPLSMRIAEAADQWAFALAALGEG